MGLIIIDEKNSKLLDEHYDLKADLEAANDLINMYYVPRLSEAEAVRNHLIVELAEIKRELEHVKTEYKQLLSEQDGLLFSIAKALENAGKYKSRKETDE